MAKYTVGKKDELILKHKGISSDLFALVFWIVMFWGEPDIADAIIHFLMEVK